MKNNNLTNSFINSSQPTTGQRDVDLVNNKEIKSPNNDKSTLVEYISTATLDTTKKTEVEYGGQKGPEPTRYGDWEKGGRVSDF